jgi:multisubunit Na+/H+ antiporter MnhB subunit
MDHLPPSLRWAPDPDHRPPPGSGAGRYIRSFLFERLVVGALGIVLPFSLVFIDWLVFHGHPVPRDSESAYYYSGMREWFTVTVGTCGFFFIAYRITESTLENTLSIVGGVAALLIAIFPTHRTKYERHHGVMKTPLQKLLGEHNVSNVHLVSAFVFIIAIGGISVLFGLAVKRGSPHSRFWRLFHFACAAVIGLALIWALATYHGGPRWSTLVAETACALAFGASWFAAGADFAYLLGRVRAGAPAIEAGASRV